MHRISAPSVADADALYHMQALASSPLPEPCRLQIGGKLTRGLGAGGNPGIGLVRTRSCWDVALLLHMHSRFFFGVKQVAMHTQPPPSPAPVHTHTLRLCQQQAAQESKEDVERVLAGADMVFVTVRAFASVHAIFAWGEGRASFAQQPKMASAAYCAK